MNDLSRNTLFFLVLVLLILAPFPTFAQQSLITKKALPHGVTLPNKDKLGKLPSDLIQELFQDYKTQNFRMASAITIGKMGQAVSKLYTLQKSFGGKLPKNMVAFYQQLVGMKVVGEYQYSDSSIVRIFWVLHLKEKYNQDIFYTKIQCIDYFLKKDLSQEWKIADAKFRNEYMLYNKTPPF